MNPQEHYQTKIENFVNNQVKSGSMDWTDANDLYNILDGKIVDEGGIGSKTYQFDDGTKIGVHTYAGRSKAAAKFLEEKGINLNLEDNLDSLYDVMSSGSFQDENRGKSVDSTFNRIARDKGLENRIQYDTMSDSQVLQAMKFQTADETYQPFLGSFGMRAAMTAVFLFAYAASFLAGPFIQNAQAGAASKPVKGIERVLTAEDTKSNSKLGQLMKDSVENYKVTFGSGYVLNKRWDEIFGSLGGVHPSERTGLSMLYGIERARQGKPLDINLIREGTTLDDFEILLENPIFQKYLKHKENQMLSSGEYIPFKFSNLDSQLLDLTKVTKGLPKSKQVKPRNVGDGNYQALDDLAVKVITDHQKGLKKKSVPNNNGEVKVINTNDRIKFASFEDAEKVASKLFIEPGNGRYFWHEAERILPLLGIDATNRTIDYIRDEFEAEFGISADKLKAGVKYPVSRLFNRSVFLDILESSIKN